MGQHFLNLIKTGETAEVVAAVEQDPALAWSPDVQGVTPLLWSIYNGHTMVRDFLVARLRLPDAPGLNLYEACAVGDCTRLRALLDADVTPVYQTSPDGWAPLHLAAAFGGPEATALLLQHGAHVHQCSHNALRNQPLHACLALGQHPETVRLLIEAGANVNSVQAGGYTPLHQAAANGNRELVMALLAAGADPARTTDAGKTAADFARERNHIEILELLTATHATGR